MQTVLIVIHLIIVIALVATVLLQRSEGGALGVGGSGGFMSGRGQANVLTRATSILAALFFATSLSLTILAGLNRAPKSILDGAGGEAAPAAKTEPIQAPKSNLFDQLKQMEDQHQAAPQAPAVPEVPKSQ
jgi:preprotein translocase subunit SecG